MTVLEVKLRFTGGQILALRVDRTIVLGRVDANVVDLTKYGNEALSVSRQHAALRPFRDSLAIRDLNSRNGTYINGSPLSPDRNYLLRARDTLLLGRLEAEVLEARVEIMSPMAQDAEGEIPLDLHLNTPLIARVNNDDPAIQQALTELRTFPQAQSKPQTLLEFAAIQAMQDPDWSYSPRLAVLRIAASFAIIPRDYPELIEAERKLYQTRFGGA